LTDRSELTGIILAGGKSSRMGREKGLVDFRGKPLIQYGLDLLSHYTERTLISSSNSDYLSFGFEIIPDPVVGQGPAAGIAAALKSSRSVWNIVIACDLPFLQPELIDCLLENTGSCQAVIPVHNGVMEPLAGIYHQELAGHFEIAIDSGELALHRILLASKAKYQDVSQLIQKYPLLFTNFYTLKALDSLNTADDKI
jgi:molybdopterin-guanine dinucleotide biosynthesis protein A